jgi:hypothetical protein
MEYLLSLAFVLLMFVIGYLYGLSRRQDIEALWGWLRRSGVDVGRITEELEADWVIKCEDREARQRKEKGNA